MFYRHKLLILIPAILLIPILLGMMPLNMVHKLASGGPFTHGKQVRLSNHCLFHSVTSHHDPTVVTLNSAPIDQEAIPASYFHLTDSKSIHSMVSLNSVPLRC